MHVIPDEQKEEFDLKKSTSLFILPQYFVVGKKGELLVDNPYGALAVGTYALYQAFIAAGFTEEQAIDLTCTQYAFAVVNAQVEAERRKKSAASIAEKYRKHIQNLKENKED